MEQVFDFIRMSKESLVHAIKQKVFSTSFFDHPSWFEIFIMSQMELKPHSSILLSRDGLHCHRDILTIDPGYSAKNGTGYAIFDHCSHRLKRCGLVRTIAIELDTYEATIEIAKKIHLIWEQENGHNVNPQILCIESPRTCFFRRGIRVNANSIIMLAVLCTRIEDQFHPELLLRPSPKPIHKDETKTMVLGTLDSFSQEQLSLDLKEIPRNLHHNVFDAVGLGLWAIRGKPNIGAMRAQVAILFL